MIQTSILRDTCFLFTLTAPPHVYSGRDCVLKTLSAVALNITLYKGFCALIVPERKTKKVLSLSRNLTISLPPKDICKYQMKEYFKT